MATLQEQLEARTKGRKGIRVPMSDIVEGIDGEIDVRVLTVAESNDAVGDSVKYRKALLRDIPEKHAEFILQDPEFLRNAAWVEKVWRACRDASDNAKPAFPSADWMRETFTAEEMGLLVESYGKADRAAGRITEPLTADQRESIMLALAMARGSDVPDRALKGLPKFVLIDLLMWVAAEKYA